MPSRDPRRDRWLLGAWLVAAFAASAVTDWRLLAAASAAAALAFARGIGPVLRRTARVAGPFAVGLPVASFAWLAILGERPAPAPFAALALRTLLVAFLGFAVLARVDLLAALAPWPLATRLLVVALAQVHALRLLATEALDGLRSRLPRRPGPVDVARNAGGVSGALVSLAARNAREISDAMRSRGF